MKQGERDSKKRIAFPIQLFGEGSSFAELPDEIHVVPTGKWDHPVYGEMEITSANVAEFIQNFKDKVRKDLRITAGHDNGMNGGELPAVGWFKELIDRGVKGLYAVVEWNAEGERLLREHAFKYFSPEFYEEYSDPETGEKRKHVLVGGALTNMPYFKELDPVVAFSEPRIINQFNEPMNLKDILAKKPAELTDEEKAFVVTNKGDLTAEQKTTFGVTDEAPAETDEEKTAREAKEAADKAAAEAAVAEEQRKASEHKGKQILMSEGEVAALRTAADQGAKALQKIEATERSAKAEKMIFSQGNPAGRFLPKQKGALEGLLATLSEKQQDQLVNLIGNMPKVSLSFAEIGDGGKDTGTDKDSVAKEVNDAVNAEIKASEGKLTYSSALRKVYSEKPELKQRYEAALAEQAA